MAQKDESGITIRSTSKKLAIVLNSVTEKEFKKVSWSANWKTSKLTKIADILNDAYNNQLSLIKDQGINFLGQANPSLLSGLIDYVKTAKSIPSVTGLLLNPNGAGK